MFRSPTRPPHKPSLQTHAADIVSAGDNSQQNDVVVEPTAGSSVSGNNLHTQMEESGKTVPLSNKNSNDNNNNRDNVTITLRNVDQENNSWQIVKRKRPSSFSPPHMWSESKRSTLSTFNNRNRYQPFMYINEEETVDEDNQIRDAEAMLSDNEILDSTDEKSKQKRNPLSFINKNTSPPPILVKDINNYTDFTKFLTSLKDVKFTLKSTNTGITVKPSSPNCYRALTKALKLNKYKFFTFQLSEDKAFRVILKNLHHTTNCDEITLALQELGFSVRSVTNIMSRRMKSPLPMFFVDWIF